MSAHRPVALVLLVGAMVALAGCHAAPADSPAQPVKRRPSKPTDRVPPPGPALLDTVREWQGKPIADQLHWQLAITPLEDIDTRVFYRVPIQWDVDRRGRARSGEGLVRANATLTPVPAEQLSIATYLSQLAEGHQIWSRTTANGYTVYMVEREVSVAPSDPNVAERYYHTGVLDVGGRIVKLDVLYDSRLHWRFAETANAIVATMDIENPRG